MQPPKVAEQHPAAARPWLRLAWWHQTQQTRVQPRHPAPLTFPAAFPALPFPTLLARAGQSHGHTHNGLAPFSTAKQAPFKYWIFYKTSKTFVGLSLYSKYDPQFSQSLCKPMRIQANIRLFS